MPRYFQNVSPFGDLVTLGRIVEKGKTLTTYDDGIANGLADQPLNWLEVDAGGNPLPEPEVAPEPEPIPEPEPAPEPAPVPAPESPAPADEPAADPEPEADAKPAKK